MFRFTIRDMLLLTLAVAIGVAWMVDRRAWRIERQKMQREMQVLETVSRAREVEALAMERALQMERAESEVLIEHLEKLKAEALGR